MNFGSADLRPYTRFQRKLDNIFREFPSIIEQFFDPYIRAADDDRTFEWSAVEKFYNDNQDTLSIRYALRMFCDFVLKLFLRFNCEHESLMMRLMYLYTGVRFRSYDEPFGALCEDCEQLKCRIQHHVIWRPLNEVNEERERIYKDYTFTHAKFLSYRSIFPSYFTNDYDELRYLVKYGLIIFTNCESIANESFDLLIYKFYRMRVLPENEDDDEDLWHDLLITMKIRNFRRLTLIFDVVSNCTLNEDMKYDHAKGFGIYSLTLTEPVISQEEVQQLLDFLFADDDPFKTYAFSSFMKVFAHSPKLPSPRSLKHLCRCKIRDSLPRSPPMPTLLFQIELLPNYLKDYILILCN